ncbi:hypothetical protein FRC08_007242 [Ceratobasidium sp. 394]|nr:hypothetical protein FRC08_007242 [Ceratobasidium sp. 394]
MPMVVADFQLPSDTFDINVSPDKRMIMLHNEGELIAALKASIEEAFASARSTYQVNDGKLSKNANPGGDTSPANDTQTKLNMTITSRDSARPAKKARVSSPNESVEEIVEEPTNAASSEETPAISSSRTTAQPAPPG